MLIIHRKICILITVMAFVILSACCAWGGVSLSAFPDPVFREYLKGYDRGWTEYDSNGRSYTVGKDDGILGDKEIERITSISVGYIKSMQGIEHLTALTWLWCGQNQLTELDVSNNTALTELYCGQNQLTALDVSKNTALTRLDCLCNQLTVFDVSNNAALNHLRCDDNQLTALDVSKNTALTELWCGFNNLTELDVSNNTTLTELACYNNQLTELDLSNNTALTELYCWEQKRSGLKVKRNSEGYYEVNMKDYVSHPENIDADSISPQPISYNKTTGIITFSEPITELRYNYITHSPNNDLMDVRITNPLSIAALERKGSETYGIICNMTENSYLNSSGNAITESDISGYTYSDYGKLGLAADGNSRLILRVQTDKPGTVSFSGHDDIGAKLESLSSTQLTASDQLNTTEINSDIYQVSAVLVAPERFPEDKNFPSDSFKIHVKFTDEDGKVTEDDLELKLEAAPVIMIPGMFDKAASTFAGLRSMLLANNFDNEHIDVWDYGFLQNPLNSMSINGNGLFKKLTAMFKKYAEKEIVCTKADIVAFGMGGLIAGKYLSNEDKASNDGNNWSVCSYKQGMTRRLITVATPHYGTPWADILAGAAEAPIFDGSSTSAGSLIDTWNFAYKYWMDDESIFSELKSVVYELLTTRKSEIPANVPMYAIYGDVSGVHGKIRKLLEVSDRTLSDVWAGATIGGFVITKDPRAAIVVSIITLCVHCLHDIVDGIDNGMFKGQAHDRVVSSQSAAGGLTGAVSGFSGEWRYRHSAICKQPEIASKIVLLLQGDLSNFEKATASSSTAANVPSKSKLSSSAENFRFIEAINLNISPAVLNIKGDDMQSASFTVTSDASMNEDIYCVIDNGSENGIFVIESADRVNGKFEVKLKFTSQDAGAIKVFCFSNNPNDTDSTSIYVSNTACMTVLADLDSMNSKNIVSLDFAGTSTIYTSVNSETPAWLYGVDENGRYYDISSPLNGTQWTSTEIARVNDNGCILGLKEGITTLTASFNGLTASVNVEVSAALEEEETPPEIITATLTNAITNQPYSLQLTASGTTPITWTRKGNFPKELTLSDSGLISGTPTKARKYTFTITASNSYGESSQKFTLQVLDPVSITTASLKAGTIGKSYNVTMRAKGSKVITWSAEGLPNGLTINAKGKISGKPTAYGKFTVKITAQNGAGSITESLPLEIKATAPKLSGSLARPTLNEEYSSGLKVTGSDPIIWSITGTLPEGLTFDTATGIISGIPASYAKSGYKLTITASNDAGIKSKNITLKVNGKAPKITAKLPGATAGENYSAEITASGSEPITFDADLPEFLSLNGNIIAGAVPESAKNFRIKIYASNPVRQNVSKIFTVKVSAHKSLPETQNTEKYIDDSETYSVIDGKSPNPENANNTPDISGTGWQNFSGYIIVAELGEISCDMAGTYDFKIQLPDYVSEGDELIYAANSDKPSSDDEIAEFFDEDGEEITAVPASRKITVSIWLNPERTYKPVIAVKRQ